MLRRMTAAHELKPGDVVVCPPHAHPRTVRLVRSSSADQYALIDVTWADDSTSVLPANAQVARLWPVA